MVNRKLKAIVLLAAISAAAFSLAYNARAQQETKQEKKERSTMTWEHSDNGERMRVVFEGKPEFNDDYTDIRDVSVGGYVRVEEDRTLGWSDYQGNNMFNSLGNIAVEPTAAVLFVDFPTGRTLHLTGRAALDVAAPGGAGDDGGTGRRVRFQVAARTVGTVPYLRAENSNPYPRSPPIRH